MKETMSCPSKRLVAKVKEFYTGHSAGDLSIMELASTLHVNQEPVIFQVLLNYTLASLSIVIIKILMALMIMMISTPL